MSDLAADILLAEEAARAAGVGLRDAFGRQHDVRFKSADQPVTEADLAANRTIDRILRDARPDYGWISEESSSRAAAGGRTWVVDPLDGTGNFIARVPEFAVCIGVREAGTEVGGVVYLPMDDVMYSAWRGHGAWRNGTRIAAAVTEGDPRIVVSAGESTRAAFPLLEGVSVQTLGSTALKMMRVAEGGADLYLSRVPKGPWDLSAPTAVVEEAGGRVSDLTGRTLRPGPELVTGGIAVAGTVSDAALHTWLDRFARFPAPKED